MSNPDSGDGELCGRCGAPVPAGADLCPDCGALLAAYRDPASIPIGGSSPTEPMRSTLAPVEAGRDERPSPTVADPDDAEADGPGERLPVDIDWGPPPLLLAQSETATPERAPPAVLAPPELAEQAVAPASQPARAVAPIRSTPPPRAPRAASWSDPAPPARPPGRPGFVETGTVAPVLLGGGIALALGCVLVAIASAAGGRALGGIGFVLVIGGFVAVVVALLVTLVRRDAKR